MTDLDPREALGKTTLAPSPTRTWPRDARLSPDEALPLLVRQRVLEQRIAELEFALRWMQRALLLLVALVVLNAIYLAWYR